VPVASQTLTAMSWQAGLPAANQNYTTLNFQPGLYANMKTSVSTTLRNSLCEFGIKFK
jgi:hypothetical protein